MDARARGLTVCFCLFGVAKGMRMRSEQASGDEVAGVLGGLLAMSE